MGKPETIQDLLVRAGFSVEQEKKKFTKYGIGDIPFAELGGHTVDSFVKKAKRRGWFPQSFSFSHINAMNNGEQIQRVNLSLLRLQRNGKTMMQTAILVQFLEEDKFILDEDGEKKIDYFIKILAER